MIIHKILLAGRTPIFSTHVLLLLPLPLPLCNRSDTSFIWKGPLSWPFLCTTFDVTIASLAHDATGVTFVPLFVVVMEHAFIVKILCGEDSRDAGDGVKVVVVHQVHVYAGTFIAAWIGD